MPPAAERGGEHYLVATRPPSRRPVQPTRASGKDSGAVSCPDPRHRDDVFSRPGPGRRSGAARTAGRRAPTPSRRPAARCGSRRADARRRRPWRSGRAGADTVSRSQVWSPARPANTSAWPGVGREDEFDVVRDRDPDARTRSPATPGGSPCRRRPAARTATRRPGTAGRRARRAPAGRNGTARRTTRRRRHPCPDHTPTSGSSASSASWIGAPARRSVVSGAGVAHRWPANSLTSTSTDTAAIARKVAISTIR